MAAESADRLLDDLRGARAAWHRTAQRQLDSLGRIIHNHTTATKGNDQS